MACYGLGALGRSRKTAKHPTCLPPSHPAFVLLYPPIFIPSFSHSTTALATMSNSNSLTLADFEQDAQPNLPLGRGLRQRQATERIQTWRESLARSQAQRARRGQSALASAQSPSAVDENLPPPPTAAPPSQLSAQQSQPSHRGLSLEELQELENDPDAEEEDETVTPGVTNITIGNPIPLVTRRNPNLNRHTQHPTPALSRVARPSALVTPMDAHATQPVIDPALIGTAPQQGQARQAITMEPAADNTTKKRDVVEVSDTDEPMEKTVPAKKKAKRPVPRPRVKDIEDPKRQAIIELACQFFRVCIVTEDAFPSALTEDMATYAFVQACDQKNAPASVQVTDDDIKMIKSRASQVRGEVASLARALVKSHYGLLDRDNQEATVQANRDRFQRLMDRAAFVYKDPMTRSGMFANSLIQEILNKAFFRNARDEGVAYREYFDMNGDGIPLPVIALIATAIHCALNEYKTGEHQQNEFSEKLYAEVYKNHLQSLRDWKEFTIKQGTNTVAKMQKNMYRFARIHANDPLDEDIVVKSFLGPADFAADAAQAAEND